MPSVCFTGRGYDRAGRFVTRDYWEGNARMHGYAVDDQVGRFTDFLVSSSSDTTKVRAARGWGTTILTYNEWSDMILPRQTDGRPVSPEYSIGYFRGQFTAMYGDTCLWRGDDPDRAPAQIFGHAMRLGRDDPRIVWTTEATRARERYNQTSRLSRVNEVLAGYAGSDMSDVMRESARRAEMRNAVSHTLYAHGDANIPPAILDRNGDIVLACCKVCGAGEVELLERACKPPPPPPPPPPDRLVPRRVVNYGDD